MLRLSAPEGIEKLIRRDVYLADLTTWRVGGIARTLVCPRTEGDLGLVWEWIRSDGLECYVVGGGSNTLISDREIEVPVILTKGICGVEVSHKNGDVFVTCGSGVDLKEIFALSVREGWSGLEFAAGVPGTVGGALMGNAGTSQGYISSAVDVVRVVDSFGGARSLRADEIEWGYRRSGLSKCAGLFISSVVMRLRKSTKEAVIAKARSAIEGRRTQPAGIRTAGCVFKNPPGDKAGRLLDKSGCKGMSLGGARVSSHHANFIENYANSTAADIAGLAMKCQERVCEAFGVVLQFEIKFVGFPHDFTRDLGS
jgi:UDP-N-acetylmuramate dehydrogenase